MKWGHSCQGGLVNMPFLDVGLSLIHKVLQFHVVSVDYFIPCAWLFYFQIHLETI